MAPRVWSGYKEWSCQHGSERLRSIRKITAPPGLPNTVREQWLDDNTKTLRFKEWNQIRVFDDGSV